MTTFGIVQMLLVVGDPLSRMRCSEAAKLITVVVIDYIYILCDTDTLGIKVRRIFEWEQMPNIILRVTIMLNGHDVQ